MTYGNIFVDMLNERDETEWIVRSFMLLNEEKNTTRLIYQYHLDWPDGRVPKVDGVLPHLAEVVHEESGAIPGPIVVHCSAGIGRTGTFIALLTLLDHIKHHDCIDLFGIVSAMRQHRYHMIQTEEQYIFVRKAITRIFLKNSSLNRQRQSSNERRDDTKRAKFPKTEQPNSFMESAGPQTNDTAPHSLQKSPDDKKSPEVMKCFNCHQEIDDSKFVQYPDKLLCYACFF